MQPFDWIGTIGVGLLSYLGWEFKTMKAKIQESTTHEQVKEIVLDKLAPIQVEMKAIADRLARIEDKLDDLMKR